VRGEVALVAGEGRLFDEARLARRDEAEFEAFSSESDPIPLSFWFAALRARAKAGEGTPGLRRKNEVSVQ
jgi:hypothetical protein